MHLLHHIDKENPTQSTLTHTQQINKIKEKLKMRTWIIFDSRLSDPYSQNVALLG